MGLDIRLPIGLMFTLLGPILVVTGMVNSTPLNIYTGASMLVFGLFMLIFGISGQRRANAERQAQEVSDKSKAASPAPTDHERDLKLVA
jgi:hypothetical protein